MNSTVPRMTSRAQVFLTVTIGLLAAGSVSALGVQHLTITQPGGMPGQPVMTGVTPTTNGVVVTWDGPSGYYQLFSRSGDDASWVPMGARTNLARQQTVPADHASAQFKVFGPAPHYSGAQSCAECHPSVYEMERATAHAGALETLAAIHQDANPSCLPCHTVGQGLPTGFISEPQTPHLAGVQCENCHGPAANHAANPEDIIAKPRVELAAQVCGGCHNDAHHPTFDEWKESPHAEVTEDMNPSGRISSCGRCHSGSARLALLKGEPLPEGDANVGITCVVCHDPHQVTATAGQLRNPVFSTNDYSLATSDVFADKYDPNVNLCAQCHNHRGASWTSSARPPHHSPQYNMLIGTVGLVPEGQTLPNPGRHARLRKQCVTCHMQTEPFVSEDEPAVMGHGFKVQSMDNCRGCHPLPEALVEFTMSAMALQIDDVKKALDLWATTKAPEALRTKYGIRAWEYTNVGDLSSGGPGPSSAEQALIPDNIKRARFNLYIVKYDGSYGVHNGPHAVKLLDAAMDWVRQELNR